MADYYPLSEEEKQERRLAWWKDRVADVTRALDTWRSCPMPRCPQGKYRYSSRAQLARHLQRKHRAR